MSDISDDEATEKPKRVMSDKQKEALKKGRELAKANREAQKKSTEKPAEVIEVKPDKKTRKKKELAVEIPEVKPEVKNEVVKGTRVSRKPQASPKPLPPDFTRPNPNPYNCPTSPSAIPHAFQPVEKNLVS